MRGGGPRTWRTRANPFESVWPQVQRWLKEHPDAIAKDLFARLQENMPGVFPPGNRELSNAESNSGEVKSHASCRSVLTLRQKWTGMCASLMPPSTPTRSAYDQPAGFQIDQTRRES